MNSSSAAERNILPLPNIIAGELQTSGMARQLKDYTGRVSVEIYHASDADLRAAKRAIASAKDELRTIDLGKIKTIIGKAMDYYFSSEESLSLLSRMTGSPHGFIKSYIAGLKAWARNLDPYLETCFGGTDYGRVPVGYGHNIIAYEKYVPAGPVVSVLPRNSEGVSLYLILQAILARCPFLIKTPSSLGSNFSSFELIKALSRAIDESKDPQLQAVKKSMNIINIFSTDQEDIIKKMEVDGATYIIFGSNQTLAKIEGALAGGAPRKIVKMGTGFSISIVLEDADAKFSADELCLSASIDRGNDCTSTSMAYIQESIFSKFMGEMNGRFHAYTSKDPFLEESVIGHVQKEDIEIISERLIGMGKKGLLRGVPDALHLSIIELEEGDHFEEFPGPVVGVRKFSDLFHLRKLFAEDLRRNGMEKNLVSAVYTNNAALFDEISSTLPSFTFKMNKGSHRMDFLIEHQGMYLIREMLDKRMLEIGDIKKKVRP